MKIFANKFCAVITDKENLLIWGDFNQQIREPHNPFKIDEIYQETKSRKSQSYMNQESVKIRTVALGWDFILATDQLGNVYSWGDNSAQQLGLIEDEEDQSFNEQEDLPKKITIFSSFDVQSVFAGKDFAILIVKQRGNDTLIEQSVHYYHTNKSSI